MAALGRPLLDWSAEERFLSKVDKVDGGCWLWTGTRGAAGYGKFYVVNGRMMVAHRWAYERWVGPVPEGLFVDHLCGVRRCVNPEHLEAVTHAENVRRAWAKRTHCRNGHPITEDSTRIDSKGRRTCRTCQKEWEKRQL